MEEAEEPEEEEAIEAEEEEALLEHLGIRPAVGPRAPQLQEPQALQWRLRLRETLTPLL